MTTKKYNGAVETNEWTLSLLSQQDLMQEGLQVYQAALDRQRKLSKGEERVAAEGNKHLMVSRYQELKARAATQGNNRLHEMAGESFFRTAMQYDQHVQQAVGTQVEKPVMQYAQYDLNSLARQQQQLLEVHFQSQNEILARSPYVEDEPVVVVVEKVRPPRGLIERIFGGQDEESE